MKNNEYEKKVEELEKKLKNRNKLVSGLSIGMACLIFLFLIPLTGENYVLEYERNFYKEMAESFCEMTGIQRNIIITVLEEEIETNPDFAFIQKEINCSYFLDAF